MHRSERRCRGRGCPRRRRRTTSRRGDERQRGLRFSRRGSGRDASDGARGASSRRSHRRAPFLCRSRRIRSAPHRGGRDAPGRRHHLPGGRSRRHCARACGTKVRFVKPHGALYNRITVDSEHARAVALAVRAYGDLVLLVAAGSVAVDEAERLGVTVVTEGFADRAYRSDGTLVPRDLAGAVIEDPDHAVQQALSLAADGGVQSVDGAWVDMHAASICVHGDTVGSVAMARRLRQALEESGFRVTPFAA